MSWLVRRFDRFRWYLFKGICRFGYFVCPRRDAENLTQIYDIGLKAWTRERAEKRVRDLSEEQLEALVDQISSYVLTDDDLDKMADDTIDEMISDCIAEISAMRKCVGGS